MSKYNPAVPAAIDRISGVQLEAEKIFQDSKTKFLLRKKYQLDEVDLVCPECFQALMIQPSINDRMYFKHKPNSDYCLFKESLNSLEMEELTKVILVKESPRHKELKNKIGQRLKQVPGINIDNLQIDNKFIIDDIGRRKPDVYCEFQNNKIAFEIQLSYLSLRYIINRTEFYRRNNIFLIWILNDFNILNQFERDIKWLSDHHNFFKLNEEVDFFQLICKYKDVQLTSDFQKTFDKWTYKKININELKFDINNFQLYYYNYTSEKQAKELKLFLIRSKRQQQETERQKQLSVEKASINANTIIGKIKELKKGKKIEVNELLFKISMSQSKAIEIVNNKLNANTGKEPHLIRWIKKDNDEFLKFILLANEIKFDVNVEDERHNTSFQLFVLKSPRDKNVFLKSLFQRNYKLTENDKIFFKKRIEQGVSDISEMMKYLFCDALSDRSLVSLIFNNYQYLNTLSFIESAKIKSITGFNYKPNEWVAFANNATNYVSTWSYIERAFRKYQLWDKIVDLDQKGTFIKKVNELKRNNSVPSFNEEFNMLYLDIYPELEFI